MSDLFGAGRKAVFSECGTARFTLEVRWDDRPLLGWLMANPSWASETSNDMTFLKVCGHSQRFGFGGAFILNSVPYVEADAKACRRRLDAAVAKASGPDFELLAENGRHMEAAGGALPTWVLAYGEVGFSFGDFPGSAYAHLKLAGAKQFGALGVTASGLPKHPMARGKHIIPADAPLREYDQVNRRLGRVLIEG